MRALTGIDLPVGSPGGSVELLCDLYLAPQAPVSADVFMLAEPDREPVGNPRRPVRLAVTGKQLEGPGFWAYVNELTAAIRHRFRPDDYALVHLQHLAFGATPALLRAFPDHPHVALVHGTDLLFAADYPTQGEVLREAAERARTVVVPTAAMADLLRTLAPVGAGRIVQIPWGVPDHLLTAPPARSPGDERLRLLYAGRLSAEKGAAAAVKLLTGLPGVTLSVAAPVAEYEALARELDPAGVRYLGWLARPRLWHAFAEHDVLLVPSTRLEAFGLVAVEAQACGLPVLYTPVPGLVEVLGESALAVDLAGDSRATAALLAALRTDPGSLADLRAAGYRNAARFPLSRTARELNALSAQSQSLRSHPTRSRD